MEINRAFYMHDYYLPKRYLPLMNHKVQKSLKFLFRGWRSGAYYQEGAYWSFGDQDIGILIIDSVKHSTN